MNPETALESPTRLHVRLPQSTAAQRRLLREHVRAYCENRPGVYRMIGASGVVLYVGKGRRLRTRLLSYFRARGRRNKSARILRHAFAIEWDYQPTEFAALLAELRLIKRHRPEFNHTYVSDDWPRAYVAITGGPVPGLRVVPRSDDPHAVALFGPFRRTAMVRDAVRALADVMHVRDCTIEDAWSERAGGLHFADDPPSPGSRGAKRRTRAPGCMRFDLRSCAGPCVGAGARAAYLEAMLSIRTFLEGRSAVPVDRLRDAMQVASTELAFERAAVLRDRLASVTWLYGRVRSFRADVDRLTFRYHAVGTDGVERVYLIRRGTLRAELELPPDATREHELEQLAARIFDGPDPTGADIPLHDLDEFHLVSSWFRRHPDEAARTRPARASRFDMPESTTCPDFSGHVEPTSPTAASGPAPGSRSVLGER